MNRRSSMAEKAAHSTDSKMRRSASTAPPTSLSARISMHTALCTTRADPVFQGVGGRRPTGIDMWGVTLLHTLEDLFVFRLHSVPVCGDVVKRHVDLFLGQVQLVGDASYGATFSDKVHDPIDCHPCAFHFRSTATINNASSHCQTLLIDMQVMEALHPVRLILPSTIQLKPRR